jgi:hypothetical protein
MALAQFNLGARKAPLVARAGQIAASPATWVALATGVLVVASAALKGPGLTQSLGDTDDAVRLLTVRELLAGGSFFDTTLSRIGAPDPLVSHWSRLIDAPLAVLMLLLRPLLGAETAELAARALWPLGLFVGIALVVAREAKRQGGTWAMGITLSLVMIMPLAMVQFRPGRIDHHNAQILCAVAGILLLRRAVEEPRAGWLAGLFIGLGLAVGYEGIALVVPVLALGAAVTLIAPDIGRGPVNAAISASAALAGALLLTTSPSRLGVVACDALSLNLVVLAGAGAMALWVVSVLRLPLGGRLAVAGTGAGLGVLVYAALEPACLAGPFGQVDAAIKSIWLDHVLETQSLFKLIADNPDAGVPALVVLAAGVAAQFALLHLQRTPAALLATAATLLAVVLGLWQIKLAPYALWLCVVPIGVLVGRLQADPRTMPLALRGLMALLLTITFSDSLAAMVLPAKDTSVSVAHKDDVCYRTDNVEKLARLPLGLIAASTDLGPYVATLTPHSVVAAPYHRIPKGILAMHTIFSSDPETARATIRALGVRYIATCTTNEKADAKTPRKSFRARLLASEAMPWLTEVTPTGVASLRIWEVVD